MATTKSKKIAQNTVILYVRMLFVLLVSLYTVREVLYVLGAEDYGVYNVVCGFVSMFGFINVSLSNAIQRFYNYEIGKSGEGVLKDVYFSAFVIQLIIVIVILVLTESFGIWYINNKMVIPEASLSSANYIFQFAVISMVFLIMSVPYSAAIMAYEKFGYYALVSIVDAVCKLAIVFILLVLKDNQLILYGLMMLGINIINFLMYYIFCKKKIPNLVFPRIKNWTYLKPMLTFSGWNTLGTFSNMMKDQGINVVLNLFFGPLINAARGVAYQVSSAIQSFIGNNSIAVRPQLTQAYAQGDTNRAMSLMFMISKLNFILLLIVALPCCVEINYILSLWLTTVPEYTGIFTIIVIAISIVNNWNSPVSLVVHASGRMRNYQLYTSIIAIFLIPVVYVALKFGASPVMAFLITFVFTVINQIVSLMILHTIVSYSYWDYVRQIVLPAMLVMLLSTAVALLPSVLLKQSFLRLLLTVLVSIPMVAYSGYMYVLNGKEKEYVLEVIAKLKQKFHIR